MRPALAVGSPGWTGAVALGGCALASGVGVLVARAPFLGLAAVLAGLGASVVVVFPARLPGLFLGALGGLLVGYAFLGKGFAYVGAPPAYVGEIGLVGAVGIVALKLPRARFGLLHLLLVAFMALGLVRTLPYVERYGLMAFRDAVLWAYAFFALAVAWVVEPGHVRRLVGWYGRFLPAFLLWVPLLAAAYLFARAAIPRAPGSNVPLAVFKGGDMGVHLTAVAVFVLLGFYRPGPDAPRLRLPETVLWLVWFLGVALAGTRNRSGLIAATLGLAVIAVLPPVRRTSRRWLPFLGVVTAIATFLVAVNPQVPIERNKTVSVGQLGRNMLSVFSDSGDRRLESTKEWRLEWWREIVDYTFDGPYFWGGKGFGVNLAADDGVITEQTAGLRSPHNSHLTVLARMGVPGFGLWVALQVGFGLALLRAFFRARSRGDVFWSRVDAWLLAYWLAMVVNASFDVYLEGPQGGIWFWSVVGLGLAAMRLQEVAPAGDEEGSWAAGPLDGLQDRGFAPASPGAKDAGLNPISPVNGAEERARSRSREPVFSRLMGVSPASLAPGDTGANARWRPPLPLDINVGTHAPPLRP